MNGRYKQSLIGWLKRSNGGAISLLRMKTSMMITPLMSWRETSMMSECKVRGIISMSTTQEQKVNTSKIIIILCRGKTNI